MSKLEDAQALLKSLEAPGHAVDDANNAFRQSEYTGDPEKIEAARAKLEAALQAQKAANINPRDIERAAQAVLDVRGESHTETNLVPPGVTSDDHHNGGSE